MLLATDSLNAEWAKCRNRRFYNLKLSIILQKTKKNVNNFYLFLSREPFGRICTDKGRPFKPPAKTVSLDP